MRQYPIGTPGEPWQKAEKQQWFAAQTVKRSYADEVLSLLQTLPEGFVKHQYGALPIDEARYPLFAFVSEDWQADKPKVLITGGVHGYETSGVHGAIRFLLQDVSKYQAHFNFIIAPCLSPWAYETINRWNPDAIDPNRSFYEDSPSPEAALLMAFAQSQSSHYLAHIDLHETTDTDDTEFRPALAAREGISLNNWGIPDGFYTVANTPKPEMAFQQAVISSVEKVTHIAPPDDKGEIIGSKVVSHGVICYDKAALFLCAGFTHADYVTTTEVYPDSPKSDAQTCIAAQVAAIIGGLDYLLDLQD